MKLHGIVILSSLVTLGMGQSQFVINTWGGVFSGAASAAAATFTANSSATALDAVESGCIYCEVNQCDTTVGYGNHADTSGETSLDAMIMCGDSYDAGSVGYIRHFRNVISLARAVMVYTTHTLLVGDGAESFADMLGFQRQLATVDSTVQDYTAWKQANCQPNFYDNIPSALTSCGPYNNSGSSTVAKATSSERRWDAGSGNHDTIGMVTRDAFGSMACGTSTNGANHKIAGRVGDSPIVGAGCYVDSKIGGAAATGDGDVMMRFLPTFYAVTLMESGSSPIQACSAAMNRIGKAYPSFSGGIVCVNTAGDHAGASFNMGFSYSFWSNATNTVEIIPVS
jgi:N4-(beta-N-acetylglucosaminyl)-L-asparaginase